MAGGALRQRRSREGWPAAVEMRCREVGRGGQLPKMRCGDVMCCRGRLRRCAERPEAWLGELPGCGEVGRVGPLAGRGSDALRRSQAGWPVAKDALQRCDVLPGASAEM